MTQLERASFGSKLGVILATAGSAVGLGNVWRFPYMAGEYGGAAFIVIYVGCVLLFGIPCMVCEFIIGRHAASNTARAYRSRAGGGMVPSVHSGVIVRSAPRFARVLCGIFRHVRERPVQARILDSGDISNHSLRHNPRRSWRYREGFQAADACPVRAAAYRRCVGMPASGCF